MIVQDDISIHIHQKKKSDVSMNLDVCPFCVSEVFRVMSTSTLQYSRNLSSIVPLLSIRGHVSWAWGDGLVSKVLASQAQRPKVLSWHLHKKPGTLALISTLRS